MICTRFLLLVWLTLAGNVAGPWLSQPKVVQSAKLTMACEGGIASYEDVKAVKDSADTMLIDVREPNELQETGVLPNSINIPLGQVENVLKDMNEEDFKLKFGRAKPSFDVPIIFSCRSGKRSHVAMETALKLGYCNVRSYGGGWLDWEKHL